MSVNNQNSTIDAEIREQHQLGLDLQELEGNPAFDRVIGRYLTKELVASSEDMITQGPVRQEALERVMSIGYFKLYLQGIRDSAEAATESLGA